MKQFYRVALCTMAVLLAVCALLGFSSFASEAPETVQETVTPTGNYQFYFQKALTANEDGTWDYRIVCAANLEWLKTLDKADIKITFSSYLNAEYNKTLSETPDTVYLKLHGNMDGKTYEYTAADGYVLLGWIITDVPATYAPVGGSFTENIVGADLTEQFPLANTILNNENYPFFVYSDRSLFEGYTITDLKIPVWNVKKDQKFTFYVLNKVNSHYTAALSTHEFYAEEDVDGASWLTFSNLAIEVPVGYVLYFGNNTDTMDVIYYEGVPATGNMATNRSFAFVIDGFRTPEKPKAPEGTTVNLIGGNFKTDFPLSTEGLYATWSPYGNGLFSYANRSLLEGYTITKMEIPVEYSEIGHVINFYVVDQTTLDGHHAFAHYTLTATEALTSKGYLVFDNLEIVIPEGCTLAFGDWADTMRVQYMTQTAGPLNYFIPANQNPNYCSFGIIIDGHTTPKETAPEVDLSKEVNIIGEDLKNNYSLTTNGEEYKDWGVYGGTPFIYAGANLNIFENYTITKIEIPVLNAKVGQYFHVYVMDPTTYIPLKVITLTANTAVDGMGYITFDGLSLAVPAGYTLAFGNNNDTLPGLILKRTDIEGYSYHWGSSAAVATDGCLSISVYGVPTSETPDTPVVPVPTPVEITNYSNVTFENHHQSFDYNYALVFIANQNFSDLIVNGEINPEHAWTVSINDGTTTKNYTISRSSSYTWENASYGYIRCDLGSEFTIPEKQKTTFTININIAEKSTGYTVFLIKNMQIVIDNRESSGIELPSGISQIASSDITVGNVNGFSSTWGDGAATHLFDGNTTGTKIGGDTTTGATISVEFSLKSATTLTYYTLYTGGDTASNPGRNPSAVTLYGKVGENWVVLSAIATSDTTPPIVGATNSTPYSYQIDNPQACSDYKVEFVTQSNKFQMNELVLYKNAD